NIFEKDGAIGWRERNLLVGRLDLVGVLQDQCTRMSSRNSMCAHKHDIGRFSSHPSFGNRHSRVLRPELQDDPCLTAARGNKPFDPFIVAAFAPRHSPYVIVREVQSLTTPCLDLIDKYISREDEIRLLAAIDERPWSTELRRRVQHYGYTYEYKQRSLSRE